MTKKQKETSIGIHALYHSDPIEADRTLWNRDTDTLSRRGFIKGAGLSALSKALGATIPFARFMPAGMIPAAFAASDEPFTLKGKDGLTVLNDRPINAETPAHLLDDDITPASRLFVRNNGIPPETIDVSNWRLEIGGESCEHPQSFSIDELKSKFKHHTYQLQLECGGNGRSEYNPPAKGNQWTTGAVGCPEWTGVRLRDILSECGVKDDAVYIGYYGADKHLSGDPKKNPISRGVPMHKANEDETLIAWAMNGEDIPKLHGYPLRLICSGWPASASGKWLKKIVIRNKVHDGAKMTGTAYRVPCKPVKPGQKVADEDMCIIESMPVKSLITYPKSGIIHQQTKKLEVRGHAWAGDNQVKDVFISVDFGTTWKKTTLKKPKNRLAWQHWSSSVTLPETGYYEVWARAVDDQDRSQPMVLPGWNPKGYLNNACHRVALKAV
jgi:DMSO/TMAO reductase YedYZ molybdopterin-dependent catalytic subunit